VLRIPRSLFLKMLESFPNSARRLRDILSNRSEQSVGEMYTVRAILDVKSPAPEQDPPPPQENEGG
jgi:CRP-like cAMP-binding protein